MGTAFAVCYPVLMPIYIMCTARGCLGYKQDDKEKNENSESIGKFAKLFEYFGTIIFIFTINICV